MLLIISNSYDPTVDYVEEKLKSDNWQYFRFNTDTTLSEIEHEFSIDNLSKEPKFQLIHNKQIVNLFDVTSVWYRRPEIPKVSEQLVSSNSRKFAEEEATYYLRCIWQYLDDKRWVSKPSLINRANTKLDQLKVAKSLGFIVPKSLATNDPVRAKEFITSCENGCIVKPFRVNQLTYGNEHVGIYTSVIRKADFNKFNSIAYTITYFQEHIKKRDELRVTVFGDEVVVAAIDSQLDPNLELDWRKATTSKKHWHKANLPKDIEKKCVDFVKSYGLQFGAIDLARTEANQYVFFEMNPNGQWAWIESDTGQIMTEKLLRLLQA